ncbi:serine/threonine-protein phosphatase [Candidatus Gracilibacteria bacterium]|nr:serine/threonine-protein phosphatase [Candidatus Gracilibacteria bacterium]
MFLESILNYIMGSSGNFINVIIFIIVVINFTIIWFFGDSFSTYQGNIKYILAGVSLFIEAILIMVLIHTFYKRPINDLKHLIQKFYVGELKGKDINIKKSKNQDVNYIITFFVKTLDTLKNIKDEFFHGKEIKGEVEIGKEIQGKMLGKKLLDIPSLNVVARSRPAGEIGGDSYDIIQQGDNYYIYVGDATGHGVGAGFIMIMVNSLISAFTKVFVSGAQILAHTNQILKPRVKANLLMSLLLVRWNEKDKKMYMTGAGHEYLMIFKHKSQKCFRVKSGGVALGMIKNIHKLIKEQQIQFEPKDIIVLYSDGITEAINRPSKDGKEEMLGEDNLQRIIEEAPNVKGQKNKSARTVFNHISIELSRFMGYKHAQFDDITLTTIEYKTEDYDENLDIPLKIPNTFMTEWKW